MKITILGSGPSLGVPEINCICKVCKSGGKNNRLRSSILISINDKNILIDTSPDFRQQALNNNIKRIDAVLFTHAHADHIFGFDDLRIFNKLQNSSIPIYGDKQTIKVIKETFPYAITSNKEWHENTKSTKNYKFTPQLIPNEIKDTIKLFGITIKRLKLMHGKNEISGFKINNIIYITDCNHIPKETENSLKNLDLAIITGLTKQKHPTHFSLFESIDICNKFKIKKGVITHMTHSIDYYDQDLPENISLAYDGMEIKV